MALLPREKWQLVPHRYGLSKVLIGTKENTQQVYEVLSRGTFLDDPASTTVRWKYSGTDEIEAHKGIEESLPIVGEYSPSVTGHGRITQYDVDEIRGDGEERLADVLQLIVDGDVKDPVEVTVSRRAMRHGAYRLPLDLIFLGGSEGKEIYAYEEERRIEAAAERLVARGGTVASIS